MPGPTTGPLPRAAIALAAAWAAAGVVACAGGEPARAPATRPPAGATAVAAAPPAGAPDDDPLFEDAGPPHAVFDCLVGDSAVYADVREDPETGDTVGVWITLWHAGDGIDGASARWTPDRAPPVPFTRVQLMGGDSIALDMPPEPHAPDTVRLVGRLSCARLWGRQRTARDLPARPALYRRFY